MCLLCQTYTKENVTAVDELSKSSHKFIIQHAKQYSLLSCWSEVFKAEEQTEVNHHARHSCSKQLLNVSYIHLVQ